MSESTAVNWEAGFTVALWGSMRTKLMLTLDADAAEAMPRPATIAPMAPERMDNIFESPLLLFLALPVGTVHKCSAVAGVEYPASLIGQAQRRQIAAIAGVL